MANRQEPQKRPAVTRRERAAAIESARQQQMARDQKRATIIGVIVVVLVLAAAALIGYFSWKANHPQQSAQQTTSVVAAEKAVRAVKVKPTNVDGNWGYLVSKNGINKPVKNVPTVSLYMDFMCPACGIYDRSVDSSLISMVDAGQINLEVFPSGFLDASSTDEYSTRSASAIAYVAQHEPQHLLTAIKAMFAEDFQPQEASNYKPVSDQQIAEQLQKGGVSKAVAQASITGTYTAWIRAMRSYIPLTRRVQHPSGQFKGQMTTPTVLINGTYLDNLQTGEAGIQQLTASMGLSEKSIGDPKVRPSLGTSTKLLSSN